MTADRALRVRNPRTGKFDYTIAPLDTDQINAMAKRLRQAQPRWASRSAGERGAALEALADALVRNGDAIVAALTTDTGRAALSRVELLSVVGMMRRWALHAPEVLDAVQTAPAPTSIPSIDTVGRLVCYPLVGAISPWNFPLILSLIDVIPALAAGCAAIVKPSEVTPRFVEPLAAAIAEVPDIAEVFALAPGAGATGAALVAAVDYVAFTGSVATGRKVAEAAARSFVPASLELGGKDPMIVLASAEPATAAAIALRASVANTGQACQSIERVYVERAIAEPFIAALAAQADAVSLNYPDIDRGDIGPFIHAPQADIVAGQIAQALDGGATILCGGAVEDLDGGLYLKPTVMVDVSPDMAIMREETFGPVIPVTVVDSVDEAVLLANDSVFGLSATVIGGTMEEAERVAVRLKAGAVSINDGGLTSMVWEREKSSFGLSGLGPSRMGDAGLLRFFRRQALLRQHGAAAMISPGAARSEEARNS